MSILPNYLHTANNSKCNENALHRDLANIRDAYNSHTYNNMTLQISRQGAA